VKKYAAIIDENAVGGWELMWIQQIPVTKKKVNILGVIGVTLIGLMIGGAIAAVATSSPSERMGNIILFAVAGGVSGVAIGFEAYTKMVTEFFNMLIFAKKN
jgi:apolipoprotein N-acyltransferase